MLSSYESMRDSDANRRLHEILRSLCRPSTEIEEWLEAHGSALHGTPCKCVWCGYRDGDLADQVEDALLGLKFVLSAAAATISACMTGVPKGEAPDDPISFRIHNTEEREQSEEGGTP